MSGSMTRFLSRPCMLYLPTRRYAPPSPRCGEVKPFLPTRRGRFAAEPSSPRCGEVID
jgi:hypothetical protein